MHLKQTDIIVECSDRITETDRIADGSEPLALNRLYLDLPTSVPSLSDITEYIYVKILDIQKY